MAVSCQTFSLGHILIGYVFCVAIAIAHDDHDGGNEDGHNSVCCTVKSPDGYCTTKQQLPLNPLHWGCSSSQWGQLCRFVLIESTIRYSCRAETANNVDWRGPHAIACVLSSCQRIWIRTQIQRRWWKPPFKRHRCPPNQRQTTTRINSRGCGLSNLSSFTTNTKE